eukprot:288939-Hanusia_phi.AAC.1
MGLSRACPTLPSEAPRLPAAAEPCQWQSLARPGGARLSDRGHGDRTRPAARGTVSPGGRPRRSGPAAAVPRLSGPGETGGRLPA